MTAKAAKRGLVKIASEVQEHLGGVLVVQNNGKEQAGNRVRMDLAWAVFLVLPEQGWACGWGCAISAMD